MPKLPSITDLSNLKAVIDSRILLEKRMYYTVGNQIEYVCYTLKPNAAVGDNIWFIVKLHYDVAGNLSREQMPDAGQEFKYNVTARASYFS